jgi:hypothetical protein
MSTILGGFGKGVDGSVSINFGTSAGKNCSKRCRHRSDYKGPGATGACYAEAIEKRPDRTQLLAKLKRHDKMPAAIVCGAALSELQALELRGIVPPWVRFSTAGSLPMPGDVTNAFRTQLRALVSWLVYYNIPVHLPIETNGKAEFYRSIVGDLVCVRESLQRVGSHKTAVGAVSWVAGDDIITGKAIFLRRIERARAECKERTAGTGRKAIVCPAIVASFKQRLGADHNPLAKCGSCTACAVSTIDVCYPKHK